MSTWRGSRRRNGRRSGICERPVKRIAKHLDRQNSSLRKFIADHGGARPTARERSDLRLSFEPPRESQRLYETGAVHAGVVNDLCPQLATVLGGPGPGVSQIQGGHVAAIGPAPAGANQALQACVSKVGGTYHELVSYQPPGHYWPLQWSELALYLGAALILGGICLWRIRRHVA